MKVFNKLVFGLLIFSAAEVSIAAQIDIPLRTWISRPLVSPEAPCSSGCKHMRLTHNPVNGLIYIMGGDHSGFTPGFPQSGRMDMFTYSIENDVWKLEQPYCRTDSSPQPAGPDEVGWIYDSKRNVFWHNPGFNWDSASRCPDSDVRRTKIMSYDPITKVWTNENRATIKSVGITTGNARFAQYDPVEDTFVVFVGSDANVYDITNDKWTQYPLTGQSQYGLNGDDYTAIDLVGRKIYYIDNRHSLKLFVYDMDTKVFIDSVPVPSTAVVTKETQAHWDPINKVVLWPHWSNGDTAEITNLYVYHPDSKKWDDLPIAQPSGDTVKGRHSVFDPFQNVLMVMGPKLTNSPVFLYRYGSGSGGVVDLVAPASPTSLSAE